MRVGLGIDYKRLVHFGEYTFKLNSWLVPSGSSMAWLETPIAPPEAGKDGGVPLDAIFGTEPTLAQSVSCFRQTISVAIGV